MSDPLLKQLAGGSWQSPERRTREADDSWQLATGGPKGNRQVYLLGVGRTTATTDRCFPQRNPVEV
jgi:hypothetical protein